MNEQEILAGLGEIVEEIAGVPAAEVTPTKSFVDDHRPPATRRSMPGTQIRTGECAVPAGHAQAHSASVRP